MRWPTPLGGVSIGSLEASTDEQWVNSIKFKGIGQINLVRAALPFIADRGLFTLVSGAPTDEYLHGGTIGTTINHLVSLNGRSSNCRVACGSISPTVLAESGRGVHANQLRGPTGGSHESGVDRIPGTFPRPVAFDGTDKSEVTIAKV
jgi:hypothetical protein